MRYKKARKDFGLAGLGAEQGEGGLMRVLALVSSFVFVCAEARRDILMVFWKKIEIAQIKREIVIKKIIFIQKSLKLDFVD